MPFNAEKSNTLLKNVMGEQNKKSLEKGFGEKPFFRKVFPQRISFYQTVKKADRLYRFIAACFLPVARSFALL